MPDGPHELFTATVTRSVGSSYTLLLPDGSTQEARLRGKFRLDDAGHTNPIAVGDHVRVEDTPHGLIIQELLPRHNHIIRKATKAGRQTQILCANLDQALFIFTVEQPFTSLGYLDRFLVMAEAYHIPVTVAFNKLDLLQEPKLLDKVEDFEAIYHFAGYTTLMLTATEAKHAEEVKALLQDKTTFLAGVSGAGKSTLINLVNPQLNLRTSPIVAKTEKGRHTTTFAQMFPLAFGGSVIDAPGFSEFGITGIEPDELSHYFPEMRALLGGCRFNNCLHIAEPGCAIMAAVETGAVAESRYNTYRSMLHELKDER